MTYLANGAIGNTKYSGTYLVGATTAEMHISYGYTYNEDGALASISLNSNSASGESAFTYDKFGRLTQAETTFDSSGTNTTIDFNLGKAYTYLTEGGATTALVRTYTTTVGGVARTYTFTYDANGNITKIVDSAGYTCRYVYDDLGQLIREDDGYTNHTYLYTYDKAGNIIKKETYNYTGAGITPVVGGSSISYGYTNSAWGDQLTSFGGNAITYDANGNPLQYYNGYNFTWTNGTELATAVNGTYNLSFSYDDNGVRVRKTVNGVDHFYTVNGTQILTERWVADQVEHLLVYLYDASGAPIGMEYRNSVYPEGGFDLYFFETNLQGDVIAVYNKLGTKVISYTYDAWGNCSTISTGAAGSDLASLNPFRYRGYYYDAELGLYYLNVRYYDPNTGRFISSDPKYISTGQGLIGNNMYAYCLNNPVGIYLYSNESTRGSNASLVNVNNYSCAVTTSAKNTYDWKKVYLGGVLASISIPGWVQMTHEETPLIKDANLSALLGNVTYVKTVKLNSSDSPYFFIDTGNGDCNWGFDFRGSSISFSNDVGVNISQQFTQWLVVSKGWTSKDGAFVGVGVVLGNTSHEVVVSVGYGTLGAAMGVCAIMAATPVPGARAAAVAVAAVAFVVVILNKE